MIRERVGRTCSSSLLLPVQTELEFEPRYPLLGGWTITFTLGYSVPLEDMVFRAPNGRRFVNATFGSPILDVVIEELVVKVSCLPSIPPSPHPPIPPCLRG